MMMNSSNLTRESECHAPEARTAEIDPLRGNVWFSDLGITQRAHAPRPDPPPGMVIEDWDAMFRAVHARLQLTVGELVATPEAQWRDAAGRTRFIVRECVEALAQLHRALTHERSQLDSRV
jgi:hypothetical protein